jgi:CelD/BcsL family acetyltransferase involved in cellulose biosynthesis
VGQNDIGLYVVRQYPGFKIDLSDYNSINDYLNGEFKKSGRYKLRKYRKRLEFSFDISFRDYCGAISQSEFDHVFTHFRRLLEKRFSEKRIRNNNLDTEEWGFYKEVSFQMINEGKAALCVIFDGEIPISVTLSYLSDKRVYDAITVFDTDYSKFHLGSVKIMYLVDWCLRKDFNVLDFSKGYFDYKTHWANRRYDFSYHIFFDKNSLKSRLLSYGLKRFFTFKQWLREKQVNEYLHKLRYRFNNKSKDCLRYDFMPVTDELSKYKKESVDLAVVDYYHLKRMCYDFLYLNNEKAKNMKIYRLKEDKNLMLIEGEKSKMALRLSFSR